MTDWVNDLANDWGHWMRKSAAVDGSIRGTLGRIREEGLDGAAIRPHYDKIPILDWPPDVSRFHRAWKALAAHPRLQGVIFVDYRMREPLKTKLDIMRLKKSGYYKLRGQALDKVAHLMATS